jgi:MFS family permease
MIKDNRIFLITLCGVKLPRWPLDSQNISGGGIGTSIFGRLLQIRWLGQISDGIFQSALASFVLFSPERQPNATAAAGAFTVVLLPYSFVGPYAGIFLDRFSRQRIIQLANILRAVDLIVIAILIKSGTTGIALTLFVLIAFGINRLILSGLSAGLPLLVSKEDLVSANALAVTGGTIGVVIGGGIGIAIKNLLDRSNRGDLSDALLIGIGALCYLLASVLTSRLGRNVIGPHEHEVPLESKGWREMVEGFRILKNHGDALRGIFATAIQRSGLTALILMGLLLERNTFNSPGNPSAGLRGFGFALAVAGVGIGVGAFISPIGVAKFGRHRWIRISLVVPFPLLITFGFFPNEWLLFILAFFVGGFGQCVKVSNDALVQSKIQDEYRGRIFAFYDVVVNSGIILGAVFAAALLPKDGKSLAVPVIISVGYASTGFIVLARANFSASSRPTI